RHGTSITRAVSSRRIPGSLGGGPVRNAARSAPADDDSQGVRVPMQSFDRRQAVETVLDNLVWLILLVVLTVFSIAVPGYFQTGIFANIIEQSTYVGTMAIGLSLVIIAGNMDLSVESVMALAAMVTGILFASAGIGLGITLPADWMVFPVS